MYKHNNSTRSAIPEIAILSSNHRYFCVYFVFTLDFVDFSCFFDILGFTIVFDTSQEKNHIFGSKIKSYGLISILAKALERGGSGLSETANFTILGQSAIPTENSKGVIFASFWDPSDGALPAGGGHFQITVKS